MIPSSNTFNKINLALSPTFSSFLHALKIGYFHMNGIYVNSVTNIVVCDLSVVLLGTRWGFSEEADK